LNVIWGVSWQRGREGEQATEETDREFIPKLGQGWGVR